MILGLCHCGAVQWRFDGVPESATACNCTICRRYGVLWAYDYDVRASMSPGRPRPTFGASRLDSISVQSAAVWLIGERCSPTARDVVARYRGQPAG